MNGSRENDPYSPLVPTDDLVGTVRQYEAQGFHWDNIYVGMTNPKKCGDKLWAVSLWKKRPVETQTQML